jgi:hypothetical protein
MNYGQNAGNTLVAGNNAAGQGRATGYGATANAIGNTGNTLADILARIRGGG